MNFRSPFLILGLMCLMAALGAWGIALSQGLDGCAFCFWQRGALICIGAILILCSRIPCHKKSLKACKVGLKGLALLFCGAGGIVAWSHLTAVFQSQVMGLARLMGTLSQAGETQKPYLLKILKTEMSLQWLLQALPFWSLMVFGALVLLILLLKGKRS